DVILKRCVKALDRSRLASGHRADGDGHRAQVGVDASVLELALLIPSPAALAGDAKTRVKHQYDDAPAFFHRPGGAGEHRLRRTHVLQAEQENHRVGDAPAKTGYLLKLAGVADEESTGFPVDRLGVGDQPRAQVDAYVRDLPRKICEEDACAAPDVEEGLARSQIEQVQNGGDGKLTVVLAPLFSHPSLIPRGNRVPAGIQVGTGLIACGAKALGEVVLSKASFHDRTLLGLPG